MNKETIKILTMDPRLRGDDIVNIVIPAKAGIHCSKKSARCQQGFTFVELLTVLVVTGILLTVFYSVFINNWSAYQDHIARAEIWQQADEVVERMTMDGRSAKQIDVDPNGLIATFYDLDDNPFVVYEINSNGRILITEEGLGTVTFSENLDFAGSRFEKKGAALFATLAFQEALFMHDIHIATSAEVYPRN